MLKLQHVQSAQVATGHVTNWFSSRHCMVSIPWMHSDNIFSVMHSSVFFAIHLSEFGVENLVFMNCMWP